LPGASAPSAAKAEEPAIAAATAMAIVAVRKLVILLSPEVPPLRRCNGLFLLAKLLVNRGTIRAEAGGFANEQSGRGPGRIVLFLFHKL
jgi:hypothetical protein